MTFRLLAFKDAGITASSLTVALISETSTAIDSECRFPFGVLIPFWSVDSFWSAAAYCRRFGTRVLGNSLDDHRCLDDRLLDCDRF
jgi:hypothetical protein